jgi:NAD(P)-dependent dehydrogenase (short-subunit alcohol dehydrogenase family)
MTEVNERGVPATWGRGHGRLAGHTALVTGSTRGLGRTMAEWLAREGANVVVSGREQPDVDASVAAVRGLGVKAWGFTADLATLAEAHALADAVFGAVPELDILINNAGMSIPQPFWEVSDDQYDEQTNVNVRSPFVLSQHAARHWIASGTRGRIVNVSTIGVYQAHRDKMVYNMAKAGVQTMTRNMSYELGGHGITVNCVAPGAVADRPGTEHLLDAPWRAEAGQHIPLGRVGRSEDIATAVIYFCLPETEWTSGQTLLVDGAHISAFPG